MGSSEYGLRRVVAFTPEEEAANRSYETSPAVRNELSYAIRSERDPNKRAVLEQSYQQDFGEPSGVGGNETGYYGALRGAFSAMGVPQDSIPPSASMRPKQFDSEGMLKAAFSAMEDKPVKQKRGIGEIASDAAMGFAKGAGSLVKGVGWLAGSDALTQAGSNAEDYWGEKQSAELQRQLAEVGKAEGVFGTIGALWKNPAAIGDYIATSIPQMIPGMGVGSIGARGIVALAGNSARNAALKAGATEAAAMQAGRVAAEKAAEKSAMYFATGANMVGEGAVSGGSTGAEVEQFMLEHGATPEQAKSEANKAAMMAGAWTTAGAGIGAGMETKAMLGQLKDAGITGFAKNVGKEALEEAIQNPGEDYAAYQAKVKLDPTQTFDPGKSATLGAVTGGIMGAGFHAAGRIGERMTDKPANDGADQSKPDQETTAPPNAPQSQPAGSFLAEGEHIPYAQAAERSPYSQINQENYGYSLPAAATAFAVPATIRTVEGEVLGPLELPPGQKLLPQPPIDGESQRAYDLPRQMLENSEPPQPQPSVRQLATARGLLNHNPSATPESIARLMRVDDGMAQQLYQMWQQSQGAKNGAESSNGRNAEVAAQGAQGGRGILPGSGNVLVPASAGDAGRASDSSQVVASGMRPAVSSGVTGAEGLAAANQPKALNENAAKRQAVQLTNQGYPTVAFPHPTQAGMWAIGSPDDAKAQAKPAAETPIDIQAHAAATSPFNAIPQPSEAQKEAGNYRKGHLTFEGLNIAIENPAGSVRSGMDASGNAWETKMQDHYGYIKGTIGKDKDHIDVFIKPGSESSKTAYVVDQTDPKTGRFDEHKVILGASSEQEARDTYQANYSHGWNGLGAITPLPMSAFKAWLNNGNTRKPLSYVEPEKQTNPAQARQRITPMQDDRLEELSGYRYRLEQMVDEFGWAEQGGRLLRDTDGNVSGRTPWIPHSELWPGRPGKVSEKDARKYVQDVLDGKPLPAAGKRFITYLLDYQDNERKQQIAQETDLSESAQEVYYSALAEARKIADDDIESMLETMAIKHGDDADGFYAEATKYLKGVINAVKQRNAGQAGQAAAGSAREGQDAGGAADRAGFHEEAHRPDFQLNAHTREEVAAKDARAADESVAAKDQADQEREHFSLDGGVLPSESSGGTQSGLFTPDGRAAQAAEEKTIASKPVSKMSDDELRSIARGFKPSYGEPAVDKAKEELRRRDSEAVKNKTPADAGVSVSGPDMAQWEMDFGIMGKYTYEPVNRAPVPEGGKLIASQIIPKKIKVSNRFSTDYEVPREIHAFRVSVVERSDGARYSQVEYMKQDIRRGDKVSATFEKMPQHAIEAREYSSINNMAVKLFEANKPIASDDMFAAKVGAGETAQGPFGPIFTEFYHDAQGAIAKLKQEQNGEAVAALHHKDAGDIDLVWGSEGNNASDGSGLAKLVKYHPEVLDDLQGFIDSLEKNDKRSGKNRLVLASANGRAVVSLDWFGERKTWLLTAFKDGDEAVTGTTIDTAGSEVAGDTARRNSSLNANIADRQAEGNNTEDAGEELSYNRRNRAGRLTWGDIKDQEAALRIKEVTKAKVYPKPDYAELADEIGPVKAHLVKQVYDKIAAKPQTGRDAPTDAQLEAYIDSVNRVMDATIAWAKDAVFESQWRPIANGKALVEAIYPNGWRAQRDEINLLGGNRYFGGIQIVYDEIKRAEKDIAKGWPGKREAWQTQGYRVVETAEDAKLQEGQSYDKKVYYLEISGRYFGGVETKAEGERLIADMQPWLLLNKNGRIASQHQTEEEAIKAARNATKRSGSGGVSDKGIAVENAERIGPARRMEGENVTSDQLKEAFGFRGVNFGTWMKGKANEAERQLHLNHAYDAFLDLAEIIGVPPKAMSLNGMLGLAIGAQGNGKYAAHFVPGVNEINLTRTSGAGSLAHEFGHALDHYFARLGGMDRQSEPFLTEHTGKPAQGELRPEILAKFKAIVKAMNERPMLQEEYAEHLRKRIESLKVNVDSWTKAIRRDFESAAIQKVTIEDGKKKREKALAKFDALVKRIRDKDLGEGRIAISRYESVSPVVMEIRELYKEAFGRVMSKNNTLGLQSNIDSLAHAVATRDADKAHVPQTIKTDYARNATALDKDKGGKPYWSTDLEKFARAFDAFVTDTLDAKAAKNSYLSHAGREGDTVPAGEERKAINEAFRALVDTIETKDTDSGVAMFNAKSGSRGNPVDAAALESTIDRVISGSPSHFSRDTVVTASLFADLPAPILAKAKKEGYDSNGRKPNGEKLTGATYDGKVYLVQENISSELEAEETLLHERIHQIVHGNAKDPDGIALRQSLGKLYIRAGAKSGIERMAKEAGIDMTGPLAAFEKVAAVNRHAFLAEEFLAHAEGQRAYEKLPAKIRRAAREFWGEFRDWLRSSKFVRIAEALGAKLDDFTQSDLAWTLKGIRQQEAGTGSKAIRFMTAWHGSPHDHDGFDSSKIGTGEGAQAYGWGHYFAGARDVAEWYKNKLSGLEVVVDGERLNQVFPATSTPEDAALSYARGRLLDALKYETDLSAENVASKAEKLAVESERDAGISTEADRLAAKAKQWGKLGGVMNDPAAIARESQIAAALRDIASKAKEGRVEVKKGRLYQVELAPAEDEYLLWDKPLSEQSDKVKAALDMAEKQRLVGIIEQRKQRLAQLAEEGGDTTALNRQIEVLQEEVDSDALNLGGDGNNYYKSLSMKLGGDKAASEYLHSIGIRGIRYLDGSSRSAGFGSHNYVIFDDADVTITAKESRGTAQGGAASPSVKAIQDVVSRFKAEFKGASALDIRVVSTTQDIPPRFRPSPFAEGVFHDDAGLIYLVTANLRDQYGQLNDGRAWQVLLHEAVGHFGLSQMMGDRFNGILKQVMQAAHAKGRVETDIYKPGHEDYATVEAVRLRYPDASDAEVAQEVLARMAEADPGRTLFGYARAAVRQWLRDIARAIGFKVETTTAELNDLVAKASAYMRNGAGLGAEYGSRGLVAASNRGLESRAHIVGDSGRYTEAQRKTFSNVGREVVTPTVKERISEWSKDLGMRLQQGIADQFAPLKSLDEHAYMLSRMSKGADGALEALLKYGRVFIKDGVYDVDAKDGGVIDKLLRPLGNEADDFIWWVAGNRADILTKESASARSEGARLLNQADVLESQAKQAEDSAKQIYQQAGNFPKWMTGNQRAQRENTRQADELMREAKRLRKDAGEARIRGNDLKNVSRENLMTPDDINALKSLADGKLDFDYPLQNGKTTRDRAEAYKAANEILQQFNKSVMDIAEESGLIDGDARAMWERDFYVPFYREMEGDKPKFPNVKSGLVRQKAFERLKGGSEKLNSDLLANTLLNWSHLLNASAKNRAAKASLEAAERVGVAERLDSSEKDSVSYRDNGNEVHFKVNDPFILNAITALEFSGFSGPAMRAMGAFKRWLTMGVTANPAFKIRNLIRDSISAIGTAELSYNIGQNLKQGYAGTSKHSQTYASMLASGGVIRFGSMIEGKRADHVRQLVEEGVDPNTIIDDESKLKMVWKRYAMPIIEKYNELGDRSENINRAALYEQLRAKGMSHAEASLQARDLMDFSMGGTWAAVRFLTQVVPFANARIQGLYKLGRAAKEDPRRMGYVVGAVALASLALLAAYSDDDDWKKREDWDRDNYWWFKIGDTAFRIPKPFEFGAIGTLAERSAELLFDKEMDGERFGKRLGKMVSDTFSMNPIPQMFKPMYDLATNTDNFTGRPIESLGMERLRPEDRFNAHTSEVAKLVGQAGVLSPLQIDHLIRGYFGWLGTAAVTSVDQIARIADDNERPDMRLRDTFLIGNFVESLPSGSSRYVTQMYEQSKAVEEAYASFEHYLKSGDKEKAEQIYADEKDKIGKRLLMERGKQSLTALNKQAKAIEENRQMSGEAKRAGLDRIEGQKNAVAKQIMTAGL